MAFSVGELAKLTGVTIRTLHHYDEIGLVSPSARSRSSYRLYDDRDVLRLHQVLLLRELGMPLDEIAAALDGELEQPEVLRRHREVLVAKRARLDHMLAELDARIEEVQTGVSLRPQDIATLFEGFDPALYEDEVKERWGDSPEYSESARRTRSYSKEDWQRYKAEAKAIGDALVALMHAGSAVTEPKVQALVEQHRQLIDRWFYPCSVAMHKRLGELYVSDPRFTENLDRFGPGYAQYLSSAIVAS